MLSIHLDNGRELQSIYRHMNQNMVKKWYSRGIQAFPTGEVRPKALLPAIARGRSGDIHIVPMLWGMTFPAVPGKTTEQFLHEIPADLSSSQKTRLWSFHRCLVPMSWYYEAEYLFNQTTGKYDPGAGRFLCQPSGADFSYLACVYHLEEGYPAFAVCTCSSCMNIFPRIPVIFGKDDVHAWLSPDVNPEALFCHRFMSLVTDYEAVSGSL